MSCLPVANSAVVVGAARGEKTARAADESRLPAAERVGSTRCRESSVGSSLERGRRGATARAIHSGWFVMPCDAVPRRMRARRCRGPCPRVRVPPSRPRCSTSEPRDVGCRRPGKHCTLAHRRGYDVRNRIGVNLAPIREPRSLTSSIDATCATSRCSLLVARHSFVARHSVEFSAENG